MELPTCSFSENHPRGAVADAFRARFRRIIPGLKAWQPVTDDSKSAPSRRAGVSRINASLIKREGSEAAPLRTLENATNTKNVIKMRSPFELIDPSLHPRAGLEANAALIFRRSPVRTFPGPISSICGSGWRSRNSIDSDHFTGLLICLAKADLLWSRE